MSKVEITPLATTDLTSIQIDITEQNYSFFWLYYAARYEFSKAMVARTWDDYLAFFVEFLPLLDDNIKRILVGGVGSGRDAVRLGSIGYCVDIVDYSAKFLDNAHQLLESVVGSDNTGEKFLSSLSTFSPPPDVFYDGILVESALQHLNHDEVTRFLLKAIGWLRQSSQESAQRVTSHNWLNKIKNVLNGRVPLHSLLGNKDKHQKVLSFRLKKSETGCVYKSVSGVGERYFTTWTEVELQKLVELLELAGAQLVYRKTNSHKDDQQGVPPFEQFVFLV